ncbi:beta-lactamase [Coniochaeta ligniaria NRRL 30616]|uniref:Beta-lactamase n=1 Tax=Coniochaeta ligniaria NRRL 30616 TaxID=1408157 RepID=A0A1J7J973_9PEZI|nr:beta-lactamase [Coniochaeta ligniaria NRRL 30616]
MSRLDGILHSHVAQGADTTDKLLGATFAVLDKHGQTIYQGSSGRADFPLDAAPYGPDTPTLIMSLTKLITATCVLQLVERGLVTLDQDVRPIVPDLAKLQLLQGFTEEGAPLLAENTKPITLRNLLTHTSGLAYDLGVPDLIAWSKSVSRTANAMTWSIDGFSTPFIFPPGEGWMYGSSLDWAGQVLEQVTGQKLGTYMEENIFAPLGMGSTTFWPHGRADLGGRLAGTAFRPVNAEGGEPLIPVPNPAPVEHEIESGGAGLYSTLGDYTKFIAAVLRGDKTLFQHDATRELLFTPQLDAIQREAMGQVVDAARTTFAPEFPAGTPVDWAFGGMVNTADVPGRRRKGSVMWSGFANAHWWIDREAGVAGVLFVTVLRDPPGDPVAIRLYGELERAVYEEFVKST